MGFIENAIKNIKNMIVPEHEMYRILKHREYKDPHPSQFPKDWPFANPPPNYKQYVVRSDPKLHIFERWMAKRGLKDPWLR